MITCHSEGHHKMVTSVSVKEGGGGAQRRSRGKATTTKEGGSEEGATQVTGARKGPRTGMMLRITRFGFITPMEAMPTPDLAVP